MNMDEFIDLCILCGCDYTHSIGGIGPVKAFNLMKDHKNIEKVLEVVKRQNDDPTRKQKYVIPEAFLYEESRELFKEPDVFKDKAEVEPFLKWETPDADALKAFLIEDKAFAESKVESGVAKLCKCKGKVNQGRLDMFFKSAGVSQSDTKKKGAPTKGGQNVGKKRA